MNKLLFLDTDTNVEIGVWREDIIINFKHNVPGFIILAFADAKREYLKKNNLSRRLRLREFRPDSDHRGYALRSVF